MTAETLAAAFHIALQSRDPRARAVVFEDLAFRAIAQLAIAEREIGSQTTPEPHPPIRAGLFAVTAPVAALSEGRSDARDEHRARVLTRPLGNVTPIRRNKEAPTRLTPLGA